LFIALSIMLGAGRVLRLGTHQPETSVGSVCLQWAPGYARPPFGPRARGCTFWVILRLVRRAGMSALGATPDIRQRPAWTSRRLPLLDKSFRSFRSNFTRCSAPAAGPMLPGTIGLGLGCSTSGTMKAADIVPTHGRSLAALAGPLGLGRAAGSLIEGILSVFLPLPRFHGLA
jgi:hypothetical protein